MYSPEETFLVKRKTTTFTSRRVKCHPNTNRIINAFSSQNNQLLNNSIYNLTMIEVKRVIKDLSNLMRQDIIKSILKLRYETFSHNPVFARSVYNIMLLIASANGCIILVDIALEKGADEYKRAINMARIYKNKTIINMIEREMQR